MGFRLFAINNVMADLLVCVATSDQSVHDIQGQNFLLGIMATVGITLRAIEYICVLSTVLADIYSGGGIPLCDSIRD